ncbi:hypothetical protein PA25_17540 [Pseudoalteromonas sp. A25]|uniref:hypothetical protein n=1 Tax=Pseudoalteromonas sp. A25 TaxID=116092 RepID=UPI0012604D41|nr:hypothetical protein [Pseudoalteromonas sp. A25]BBN81769.1 hypothetical protein PA25_17540 [Pseudoalteromonas sp. A25]
MPSQYKEKRQSQLRHILLYVAYGDNALYYQGIKTSILSVLHHCKKSVPPEIVVISENPAFFADYPIIHFTITPALKLDWSLNNRYHYRIKNRALAYALDNLNLGANDKLLALDTDTYLTRDINELFDKINVNQSLMFLDEGPLTKKQFTEYRESYQAPIKLGNEESYHLSHQYHMWGSLMVGITASKRALIDQADQLLIAMHQWAPTIRTVEQFAISQVLSNNGELVEGKKLIQHYSHRGRKHFAQANINSFFANYGHYAFETQLYYYPALRLRRTLMAFLSEKVAKLTQFSNSTSRTKAI